MMQDQFFTIRAERYVLPLKASAKSMGLGHRARHVAHRRDGVRRADGAGRGQQPAQGGGAGDPARVAPHPGGADRRRRGGGAGAARGPRRRWRRSTRARRRRGWRSPTAAARRRSSTSRSSICAAPRHPLLALRTAAEPTRSSPTTSRSGGGAAADPDRQRPQRGRQDGADEDGRAGGADGAGRAAGRRRRAAAGSASSPSVRADIGDRQSVLGDLSTFSGHLANVADDPRGTRDAWAAPTLVLLDELMAGTNPDQGAALARATAETLAERPVLAIITTHYDSLKALGESDARFANAGMEYDLEHLRPTFRLAVGRARALVRVRHRRAHGAAARRCWSGRASWRARRSVGLESVIARLEAREAALAKESATPGRRRRPLRLRRRRRSARPRRRWRGASASWVATSREAVEAAIAEARDGAGGDRPRGAAGGHRARRRGGATSWPGSAAEALAKLPAPATPRRRRRAGAGGRRARVRRAARRRGRGRPAARRPRARQGHRRRADRRGRRRRAAPGRRRRAPGGPRRPRPPRAAARRRAAPRRRAGARLGDGGRTLDLRGQTGDEALAASRPTSIAPRSPGESHVVDRPRPRHRRAAQAGARLPRRVPLRRPLGPRHAPPGRRRRQHRRAAVAPGVLGFPGGGWSVVRFRRGRGSCFGDAPGVVRYAAHRRSDERWRPSPQTAKERARTPPKQEPRPHRRGLQLVDGGPWSARR